MSSFPKPDRVVVANLSGMAIWGPTRRLFLPGHSNFGRQMTSEKPSKNIVGRVSGPGETKIDQASNSSNPEWADGLKQLYDSVVDEDLPDSLRDLLSQLDKGN